MEMALDPQLLKSARSFVLDVCMRFTAVTLRMFGVNESKALRLIKPQCHAYLKRGLSI